MIVFTLSNTSAPFRLTLECELNSAVVQRTTLSVFIYHFHLYQCHIRTVCMKAFGVLDSGKFQTGRFTGCIYSITTDFFPCFIVADSFQFARFEGYVVESKEKIVLAFAFTQGVTIQEKFHLFSSRYYLHRFYRIFRIVPMADDVGLVFFRIYPSVPHYLMCVESIFFDTHRVRHSTSSVVFRTPVMSVSVGEDNFSTAGADSVTRSGTLTPIIIPAGYHGDGKFILVAVIVSGRLSFIKWSVTFFVERIAVFIPVLS